MLLIIREADLVIGQKSGQDNVLLTLLERKTRQLSVVRLPDKSLESVMNAFDKMKAALGASYSKVFRTITTGNGSESSRLSELENGTETKAYFTHPYTSCKKGSIENHNGLIRHFIPKGKRIADYSDEDLLALKLWANGLPRKILGKRRRMRPLTRKWTKSLPPKRGRYPVAGWDLRLIKQIQRCNAEKIDSNRKYAQLDIAISEVI